MKYSILIFSLFAILQTLTFGATSTWDGNNGVDPSTNWTFQPNWGTTIPTFSGNYNIVFSGTNKLNNIADDKNWEINSLTFSSNSGNFSISGQKLTTGVGGITNNSTSTQTISNQIELSSNQSWTSVGNVVISGYIDGKNKNLNLDGSGTITLSNQLNSANVVTLNGTGNRNIGNITGATEVRIQNTGTNVFSGQINTNKLQISSGNNTFNGTINSQNQGISISGNSNSVFNGEINSGNSGINFNGSGNVTFNGKINNAGILSINGGGAVTLTGDGRNNISNTFVQNGNLILDQSDGTSINGELTVGDGGVVTFQGNNQLPSWQTVTLLEGSTMYLNNTTQTITNLVITGDSILDFGNGGSTFDVQNLTVDSDAILTIQNWNTSVDFFIASSNPTNSVIQVYYADTGQSAAWNSNGGFIRPVVPEPSTYGLVSMFLISIMMLFRRSYYMNKRLTN